jgi:hypothetical protein
MHSSPTDRMASYLRKGEEGGGEKKGEMGKEKKEVVRSNTHLA